MSGEKSKILTRARFEEIAAGAHAPVMRQSITAESVLQAQCNMEELVAFIEDHLLPVVRLAYSKDHGYMCHSIDEQGKSTNRPCNCAHLKAQGILDEGGY